MHAKQKSSDVQRNLHRLARIVAHILDRPGEEISKHVVRDIVLSHAHCTAEQWWTVMERLALPEVAGGIARGALPAAELASQNSCNFKATPRVTKIARVVLRFVEENGGTCDKTIRELFRNSPDTSKALRVLVASNIVRRAGAGGRLDPFRYWVVRGVARGARDAVVTYSAHGLTAGGDHIEAVEPPAAGAPPQTPRTASR